MNEGSWALRHLPRCNLILATIIVFAVPFEFYYRVILFHFYVSGSFLLDTGLLASLMYHNTAALIIPASVGGGSFFAAHVSPILILVSGFSYLVPFSMPQIFAGFVGVCYVLLSLGVFWLLTCGYAMQRGWPLVLATLASCAFACNGLCLDIVLYPHFETLAAACLLLFFVALVLQSHAVAVVSFLIAIATREDVGLHAFGFLFIWLAVNRFRRVPWRDSMPLVCFAVAGLAYSGVALMLQHRAFPAASSFVRVYLGDPPLSHLSAALVETRLSGWLWLHLDIILPAVIAVVWSMGAKNPYTNGPMHRLV